MEMGEKVSAYASIRGMYEMVQFEGGLFNVVDRFEVTRGGKIRCVGDIGLIRGDKVND